MIRLRTLLSVPVIATCALVLMTSNAWPRYSDPRHHTGSGPLDDVDPNAKKSLIAHDIGNVRMTLSNWGELGNPDATPGYKGFEWPINSGNDFLFSAGIWIGAELNGIHHVSTTTDGDNGTNEFYPVHIGTIPTTRASSNFGDWFVSSKNFSSFNDKDYSYGVKGIDDDGDWNAATDDLDHNGRPSDNWDGDSLDANGDGNPKYDPEPHIDEDPPGDNTHWYLDPDYHVGPYDDDGDGVADEDGNARGVQEYMAVYHDMIPPQYVGSPDPEDPHTSDTWLNVVVTQRSYAFPEAYAGDFILIDYRIKNVGQLPLKHVYIAAFADADVGAAGEGGDAASLDDSTYYDPDRLMMVMTDSNTDADGPAPGQIAVRVVKTPVPLDQLRLTYANFERVSGGDPPTDADKYNLISSGQVAAASPQYGDWRMLLAFGAEIGNGFEIPPGGVLPITIAMMAGADIDQVRTNAEWALAMYLNDFQGPSAPDVPEFTVDVFGDSVQIQWTNNAETSVDAITGLQDFEGYIVERSTDQINWETIGAWDVPGDHLEYPFEWQNFNLGLPGDTVVRPNGDTTIAPGTRRWEHPDQTHPEDSVLVYSIIDHHLIPGHTYYYVVRAFDQGVLGAGILYSGRTGNVIPAIMARNATTGAPTDLKHIYVYPNPYKGSHPGEAGGQVNPTKGLIEYPRKLYFMGLPAATTTGECVINIYSLAGDALAKVDHHNGLEYDQWDMITKNKQEIVSGIYYYVVDYKKPGGGTDQFIDKFVVIK